jgi:hypothetical protein
VSALVETLHEAAPLVDGAEVRPGRVRV